jgi:hypothetical protein
MQGGGRVSKQDFAESTLLQRCAPMKIPLKSHIKLFRMHLRSAKAASDMLFFQFSQLISFFRVKILKTATLDRRV